MSRPRKSSTDLYNLRVHLWRDRYRFIELPKEVEQPIFARMIRGDESETTVKIGAWPRSVGLAQTVRCRISTEKLRVRRQSP
jgi:hypothetical protein